MTNKMTKLNIGCAGVPTTIKNRNTLEGVAEVKRLGLDNMEMEFVHGVRMSEELAKEVGKAREKEGILLSAHGPYYINLNSENEKTTTDSAERIIHTARIANIAGATTITFHAAYYMKNSREDVYNTVKKQLQKIIDALKLEKNNVEVRPELTGKETQFGNLQELIRISQEIDQVLPCIDFSHMHARFNGKYNTYDEFRGMLVELEKGLGKSIINNMHIHISGINYNGKGERNHLLLKDSDLKYKELLKALKDFGVKGIVVCESPDPTADAILLKNAYKEL